MIHVGQLNKEWRRFQDWKENWMQLSFVGRDDHNEDNVMEVTVPGKNDIKEYGR